MPTRRTFSAASEAEPGPQIVSGSKTQAELEKEHQL